MIPLAFIIGGGLALFVFVVLLVWRNAVYEREAIRHREMMRMLYGIYKVSQHEN